MNRTAVYLAFPVALLMATGRPASGEVFVLASGGQVAGELLNRDESPREKYVVKTASGARVTLDKSQVAKVLTQRPEEIEYTRIRPSYADTVDGQWALAEWCREHKLNAERTAHLARIIELDPNQAEARRALGYSQVEGKWTKQGEAMLARGYKLYKGRWRTTQEIELLENERKAEVAQQEWFQKVKRWRVWLGTDKDAEGRRSILGIKDPVAVKALIQGLETERSLSVKTLYIETLSRIATPEATHALAVRAIDDPNEEVRLTCLDYLQGTKDPEVVALFVRKLRDKDNHVVNLAAIALNHMKDPSATGALIDALVTQHKYKVTQGGGPGSISTTFGTGPGGSGAPGGGGLAVGGGPKIVIRQVPNQPVLDALITLTGQNFSFDQQAWKYWHASQKQPDTLNARRN